MLDITQLDFSLWARPLGAFGTHAPDQGAISTADSALRRGPLNAKPTVTWRMTRLCNQNCLNCLSDSRPRRPGPELSTEAGKAFIRNLAAYGVPRLVLAGGEPLLRPDLLELVAYAHELGVQPWLLTNGTLLTGENAVALQRAGLHSASILLEGIGRVADGHRAMRGACPSTLDGYMSCHAAGIAAEIRMPLTRGNYLRLAEILDSIERWKIRRVVFAHMVYAGRGNRPAGDLCHEEKRRALDLILSRAEDFHRRGVETQIATDENHADGIYFYVRLARTDPWRAAAALRLLPAYAADVQGAGVGQAAIDPSGNVSPDPYWSSCVLGNVRETPFSEIWGKSSDTLLRGLRNRLPLLKGRCGNCRWRSTCGGNLRVRAEQYYGDPWTSDPACYLNNKEIGKPVSEEIAAMEGDVLLSEIAA